MSDAMGTPAISEVDFAEAMRPLGIQRGQCLGMYDRLSSYAVGRAFLFLFLFSMHIYRPIIENRSRILYIDRYKGECKYSHFCVSSDGHLGWL